MLTAQLTGQLSSLFSLQPRTEHVAAHKKQRGAPRRTRKNVAAAVPGRSVLGRDRGGSCMADLHSATHMSSVALEVDARAGLADFFVCPIYMYNLDARMINEQLRPYYVDKSPANRELKRLLGDYADLGRRRVFINCLLRRRWAALGLWNPRWGVPGRPGETNDVKAWRWRWNESAGMLQQRERSRDVAARYARHIFDAQTLSFEQGRPTPRSHVRSGSSPVEAEDFLSTRPWFVYAVQVQQHQLGPRIGRRPMAKAMERVRSSWMASDIWRPEWDIHLPAWSWSARDMSIEDPLLLADMLSDKERAALDACTADAPLTVDEASALSQMPSVDSCTTPTQPKAPGHDVPALQPAQARRLEHLRQRRLNNVPRRKLKTRPSVVISRRTATGAAQSLAAARAEANARATKPKESRASVDSSRGVMAQIHGPRYTTLFPADCPSPGLETLFAADVASASDPWVAEPCGVPVKMPTDPEQWGKGYASAAQEHAAQATHPHEESLLALPVVLGEEGSSAVEHVASPERAPRIEMSIANFKLGLSSLDFTL